MSHVNAEAPINVSVPREPHEMLSVTIPINDPRPHFRINFSSLDIMQTCKRKGYFALKRGLISNVESAPLIFGSAIHAALEVWYCAPSNTRGRGTGACDDSQELMLAGAQPLAHGSCVRCSSVFAFIRAAEPLRQLPDGDKRSLSNGLMILNNYFDTYEKDPFTILHDEMGPVCERKFEVMLMDTPEKKVTFFGTIDSILINEETKNIVVVDHKTTSSLGADFLNRIRPNFQYTGYVLAAQKVLKLNTDTFMSNGIQVAKTVRSLGRQVTKVTQEDFDELSVAIDWATDDYLKCMEYDFWPMTTPNACTQWGGCTYRPICELPRSMQENMIATRYEGRGI